LGASELKDIPSLEGTSNVGSNESAVVHVLDFGGGEVGYYRYTTSGSGEIFIHRADKLKLKPAQRSALLASEDARNDSALSDLGIALREYLQTAGGLLREDSRSLLDRSMSTSLRKKSPYAGTARRVSMAVEPAEMLQAPVLFIGITGHLQRELAGTLVPTADGREPPLSKEVSRMLDFLNSVGAGTPTADVACMPSWRIHPFFVSPHREAALERRAISWLMDQDVALAQAFAHDADLQKYLREQVSSWLLLRGQSQSGRLEKAEFIERFCALSKRVGVEEQAEEAITWFESMDTENVGSIAIDQMLEFILHEAPHLLQSVIRQRLFVGSIAGGTASFQLTLADPKNDREVLLFSAPIGNHSPSTGSGLDGKQVFPEKCRRVERSDLMAWQERVREVLAGQRGTHGRWPSQRRGIFIGISSMFYAAETAGIDRRLVSKRRALEALRAALEHELVQHGPDDTLDEVGGTIHQQRLANLAMTLVVIQHVLHEEAWLYFRREWSVIDEEKCIPFKDALSRPTTSGSLSIVRGDTSAVANWSLGWFLDFALREDGLEEADRKTAQVAEKKARCVHFEPNSGLAILGLGLGAAEDRDAPSGLLGRLRSWFAFCFCRWRRSDRIQPSPLSDGECSPTSEHRHPLGRDLQRTAHEDAPSKNTTVSEVMQIMRRSSVGPSLASAD